MSATAVRTIQHRIAGREVAGSSDRTAPVFDPATGAVQAEVALATAADVDAAVQAARTAFETWGDVSVTRRARVMFKFRDLVDRHMDDLARVISSEHGKVLDDAKGEVIRGMEVVEFACGIPQLLKGEFSSRSRPTSTPTRSGSRSASAPGSRRSTSRSWSRCGCTPWPSPWEHVRAQAVRARSVRVELRRRALPRGGPAGRRVQRRARRQGRGRRAARASRRRRRLLRGLTPIAKYVHETATAHGKRVQALGGAKNHAVVMPDANLDFAANHLTAAGYGSAGPALHGDLRGGRGGRRGRPADRAPHGQGARGQGRAGPGSLVRDGPGHHPGRARADRRLHRPRRAGRATAVVDGRELEMEGDGFYVGPTLFDNVQTDMDIYTDEIFGPVLAVVRVPTLEAAIELINSSSFANGTAIFTAPARRARLPAQGRGRHDRHQHPDPGPDGLLLLRRLEGLAVRRPPHPRAGGDPLLYAREGDHHALARGGQDAGHHRGHMHFPTAV
jgi:malonate-semialdehyde dehydrogenase (acetylating)/methylmalonate-semialdehyde dehydrogenase